MFEDSHQTKGLLRLTMACNERCPFCNVPQEDYAKLTPSPAEIARQLEGFRGQDTLTISGGEPTLLKKRLLALIRGAREMGIPSVEIQTNAVLIDEAYARALAEAGATSAFVSLLSDVAEHHDALAGLEGAYELCLRGIDAMLDAGMAVTLNPVLARRTQARIADYIDFVARRLPGVRSISLSAVQPHGRAGRDDNTENLLPDYDVLAAQVPRAHERARAHGIALLNPYCGLPLCVGWTQERQCSVEAFEAERGGWRPTPGLENTGDKVQGASCGTCAWRTRCGGAWRAYWEVRDGRGLVPPSQSVAPWSATGAEPDQTVVDVRDGLDAGGLLALRGATTPTVWLWARALPRGAGKALLSSGCTDLALSLDASALTARDPALLRTLKELEVLLTGTAGAPPQTRLQVHLQLSGPAPARAALVTWARQHEVDHISQRTA